MPQTSRAQRRAAVSRTFSSAFPSAAQTQELRSRRPARQKGREKLWRGSWTAVGMTYTFKPAVGKSLLSLSLKSCSSPPQQPPRAVAP